MKYLLLYKIANHTHVPGEHTLLIDADSEDAAQLIAKERIQSLFPLMGYYGAFQQEGVRLVSLFEVKEVHPLPWKEWAKESAENLRIKERESIEAEERRKLEELEKKYRR